MDDNKKLKEIAHSGEEVTSTDEVEGLNLNPDELTAIRNKRKELDVIQADLDDLMERLNVFIGESVGPADEGGDNIETDEDDSAGAEKQDGPQEKDLLVANLEKGDGIRHALYTTSNGTKPPEINWTAVGPVLQKHVEDLQRLQDLNEMTSNVVNRIRNITQLGDSITESVRTGQDSLDSGVSQSGGSVEEVPKPNADGNQK